MYQPIQYDGNGTGRSGIVPGLQRSTSILQTLWRRGRTVGIATAACIVVAILYLCVATRVYRANALVLIKQDAPDPMESTGEVRQSENYVQDQADVFQAAPVLQRALDGVNYRSLKTFAKVTDDPVEWLQHGGALKIEVQKKSSVIVVSMDSRWPQEAATIADSVVNQFIAELAIRRHATGAQMLTALEKEREDLERKRHECTAAMLKFKQENGVLSFGADSANTALERAISLSSSLTTAEMATMDLRAQLNATNRALANPATLSAFVEAQQFKTRNAGDSEYDQLRGQVVTAMVNLSSHEALEGPNNSRVLGLETAVARLQERVAAKERAIARAHLVEISNELATAEENERALRESVQLQRAQLLGQSPQAAEYAKLEADVLRIQKQGDAINARIDQIAVNEMNGQARNVQILEPARVEAGAVKPGKGVILIGSMMFGAMLGIWIALVQEYQDLRFRDPQEILPALGTPLFATIPTIDAQLSPVERGQILWLDTHSSGAEAYRSIRTSLQLGSCRDAKTMLVASATAGEGKSTTASNLAIALAQAGLRTLLVDCDLHQPVQHRIFDVDGSAGFSDVLAGTHKLASAIRQTHVEGLYVLPSGPRPDNAAELLAGNRFGCLMRALSGTFDRIVIDSPPLTRASDARIIASSAEATLLVLRINHSTYRTVTDAIDQLRKVGANLAGVIANDMPISRSNGYRGSWEAPSSAKRLYASITRKDQENSPGLPATPAAAFEISEPNWLSDQTTPTNDDKITGEPASRPPDDIQRKSGVRRKTQW